MSLTAVSICYTTLWRLGRAFGLLFASLSVSQAHAMLSVVHYGTLRNKVHRTKMHFFEQRTHESPREASVRVLKMLYAEKDTKPHGFWLLSQKKWEKAHVNPPQTAPINEVSFPIDFHTLEALEVYFKDPKRPGENLKLHEDEEKYYRAMRKGFYRYLDEGVEYIQLDERTLYQDPVASWGPFFGISVGSLAFFAYAGEKKKGKPLKVKNGTLPKEEGGAEKKAPRQSAK